MSTENQVREEAVRKLDEFCSDGAYVHVAFGRNGSRIAIIYGERQTWKSGMPYWRVRKWNPHARRWTKGLVDVGYFAVIGPASDDEVFDARVTDPPR